jgi:hypothetical protein
MSPDNYSWKWKELKPGDSLKIGPCIYIIQLMDPANPSEPFTINRFAAPDPNGIIQMGQTTHLVHRRSQFLAAISGKTQSSEGLTFRLMHELNPWMREIFGPRKGLHQFLRFSYIETKKNLLLLREAQEIYKYCSLYGEPPLVVGQVPGYKRKSDPIARKVTSRPYVRKIADEFMPTKVQWLTAPPRNPLLGVSCVYRAHIMRLKDLTRPYPIPRFGGTDIEGIVEIGHTTSFGLRKNQFKSGVVGATKKGEGGLLHFLDDECSRLQRLFGPNKDLMKCIYFSYYPTPRALLRQREWQLHNLYIRLYAEPPVLNSQLPGKWRHFDR